MNYEELLELSVELGYQLQLCGAETYRVEESIVRLLEAYGVRGEAFVIPNCLIVSLETEDGKPMTRMRRTGYSSTNLDGVERYNAICRRLCVERPDAEEAMDVLRTEVRRGRGYRMPILQLAYFLGAAGFCMFFGGTWVDCLCAGVCGVATGLWLTLMSSLRTNVFFKTVSAGFVLAFLVYGMAALGLADNVDAAITGTIMLLVPGLLFIYSVRDVIYGDTMSGVNRLVQVLITAIALVVGTGAALSLSRSLWGFLEGSSTMVTYNLFFQCVAGFIGSIGFCILFNIQGRGMILCLIGSVMSWLVYSLFSFLGMTDVTSVFLAAAAISLYAEIMARVRKCPATPYLVVSMFPLIPGADIYYTMDFAFRGDLEHFLERGMRTISIAGALAFGVLLVSTAFRMWGVWRRRKANLRKS